MAAPRHPRHGHRRLGRRLLRDRRVPRENIPFFPEPLPTRHRRVPGALPRRPAARIAGPARALRRPRGAPRRQPREQDVHPAHTRGVVREAARGDRAARRGGGRRVGEGREGVGHDRWVVCEERGAVPPWGDGVVGGLCGCVLAYDGAQSVGGG